MKPHRIARDEQGFSLSELIIVVGLMGTVIAMSWAGLSVMMKGNDISTSQGNSANAFANPVEEMSMILMQNGSVKSAAPNRVEVWTDRQIDGTPELNAFYVNSSGELIWESWKYNSARTSYTSHNVWVMDNSNANVAQGVPLFAYYDRDGSVLTGTNIAQKGPSDTVYMKLTVIVHTTNGTTSDTRGVYFRNRS